MASQRRREVYGFHFDPSQYEDIARDEEYSSADYDTDDIHDYAYGDSTDDGETTDTDGAIGTCNAYFILKIHVQSLNILPLSNQAAMMEVMTSKQETTKKTRWR